MAGDPITGTSGADTLTGTLEDDVINALGGRDTINASQGHDMVDGGANTLDRLVVTMANSSLFAQAATGSRTYTVVNGHIGSSSGGLDTSFVNVERIVLDLGGTGDFGDTIDSTAFTAGALELRLGNGDDIVNGGAGNETVYGRGGVNWIDTGAGLDSVVVEADFSTSATVVISGSGNLIQTEQDGVVTNTIFNAEQLVLGFNVDAPFLVDGQTHTFDASGYVGTAQISFADHNGDDVFIGSAGADFFGNTFNATIGNDTYTGGGGADIYDYTVAINALNHDIITDFDADDTIDFQFNDGTVPGQLLCNSFIGGAAFSGVAGQYRYAVVGNQTEVQIDTDGDAVADHVLTISNGAFALAETAPGSNILMLANPINGTGGNDMLFGTSGSDTITGLAGDDLLKGNGGDDVLDGGDGYDRATYYQNNEALGGVTVNLNLAGAQYTGSQGWDTLTGIEYLSGTPFADTLTGDGNDNILWGSTATIDPATNWVSTTNNDTLDGGGGNDLLNVGIGNHSLIGGDGNDTVGFTENWGDDPAISISLALQGAAQDTGQGLWTLSGIENLSGGDDNDLLTGDGNANILAGSIGNDTLSGGGGNDTLYGDGAIKSGSPASGAPTLIPDIGGNGNDMLEGGDGDDQLWGGGGSDTASYEHASGAVQVTLVNGTFGEAFGAAGHDQLNNMENLTGSAFNDSLTGNGLTNVLIGGDGRDFLQARGGDDSVYGGDGDDFLGGGTGNDLLDGGAGWDRVSFANGATAPVTVDLRIQGIAQDTGLGLDTLIGIEHVSGTAFGDTLIGNAGDNWLWGGSDGSDNDTIDGQEGNDLIENGAGDHVAIGGDGTDTFRFNPFNTPNGATISLALQGSAQDTGAGMMTLSGFENLSGSVFDDTLIGDGGGNVLAGNGDDDTLIGGAGDDALYGDGEIRPGLPGANSGPINLYADVAAIGGFDGNDVIEGGLGNDLIDGGGGTDTASYANAGGAVAVDLGSGLASGADGNDTLSGIENLVGSAFGDELAGDGQNNLVQGGAGGDAISGNAGNDTLEGGDGNDCLRGDEGDDVIRGGNGFDRISFALSLVAVSVDLNIVGVAQATGQGNDTLEGIEHVSGTAFSDTLVGDGNDNWLWGGSNGSGITGNDTISGGGGNDLIEVGAGNHSLDGGSGGSDTLSFYGNATDITAAGITYHLERQGTSQNTEQGVMFTAGFENVSGSIYDDLIYGDDFANILAGDLGNDTIRGNDGNDIIYGDGRILVDGAGSGAIRSWTDISAAEAAAGGNDTLLGGRGDDWIYGGRGNDLMTGNQGADRFVIEAGSGSDRITDFAAGVDKVVFDPLSGVDAFSDLTLTRVGSDTKVSWGTSDSILIQGLRPTQLHASDFEFGTQPSAALADVSASLAHGSSFGSGGFDAFDSATAELATHAYLLG